MLYRIGSARHDEKGKLTGGAVGDNNGHEVEIQDFYIHSKGWIVLRAKRDLKKIGERMIAACQNNNIGYDQSNRLGVCKYGIDTKIKTECDCSALVRQCIKEALGVDVGNFTTSNERKVLVNSGLFDDFEYSNEKLYVGDILVTKTKGHTVVVVESPWSVVYPEYYPRYTGKGTSLVSALATVGEKDTSFSHRKKIAWANGITNYSGTAAQNIALVDLLKAGKCIKK